ncbi:MAG: CoA activase [Chitinivibrionales bacterium]|nr:CoA activase [Chitinivibrionales bacterium]MBD3358495.1 CoA activase [Chitinivibrionales bacterium]
MSDKANDSLRLGIDIGSTTVKAVVVDGDDNCLWRRYTRHNTRQSQTVHDFLMRVEESFPNHRIRPFVTGSGGRAIAPLINARYIQEVNAVTYAVEKRCPDVGSVVELGGQDAKVIIWKQDIEGRKTTLTFMNDKCAGGTGATLDKIFAKIGVAPTEVDSIRAKGIPVHRIAAKCGVFAETDVVGLLKSGVARDELVVSLCTAVVKQNLEVLVRGNVLRDRVLLLGGPHTYIPAFVDIWREHIPETWRLHGWSPRENAIEELIYVPEDAQYFAAFGAVLFGIESEEYFSHLHDEQKSGNGFYEGSAKLEHFIGEGRTAQLMSSGAVKPGLVESDEEVEAFAAEYAIPSFKPPLLERGSRLGVYIGVDGGSTSSKVAVLDTQGNLLHREYVLSIGNPISDVRGMFGRIREWASEKGVELDIFGTAVTGYASEILHAAFSFDLAVVETVAHMRCAVRSYGEVDIICDVGGQDIKVLFMKHGRVVDFKLNTQCSAGNGYFLQSMAEQFAVPITDYAHHAFKARRAPAFNYGCAVFMEQDRVNFQQLGWTNEEIMAGLALVLPLNIWNYVVQEPNVARFGNRVVLQGGTQKNLAAVKAQVDYIRRKVPHAEIHVNRYADISGAIGAALEVAERMRKGGSRFIGLEAAASLAHSSRNDDSTICRFCANNCRRTFVEVEASGREKVRFISGAGCERGTATEVKEMREKERERFVTRTKHPNLLSLAADKVFTSFDFLPLPADGTKVKGLKISHHPRARSRKHPFVRSSWTARDRRSKMVIGMPRLLNLYLYGPFFSTYFRTLGVGGVVWSDFTSNQLWEEGNKWGAIDPCFPAKVAPAHIYNLINKHKPTHICFPIVTHLESVVENTLGNTACVIQMGTPEVVHAVFTRDRDLLAEAGIEYWKPLVRMDRAVEAQGLLYEYFHERLGVTEDENAWAVRQGYAAMHRYLEDMRAAGGAVINRLIDEDRIGILVLGHPYHHDPGLSHQILDEFQMRGFPVLTIESLPADVEFLGPLFAEESADGIERAARDIKDIWSRNFNRNTNLKIWAAKVAARHPNLAVIDLSSFKCGHDAPTYSYIDNILDASETPHFLFHDLDQNKPRASIVIRIQTIEYFLRLEEERLRRRVR